MRDSGYALLLNGSGVLHHRNLCLTLGKGTRVPLFKVKKKDNRRTQNSRKDKVSIKFAMNNLYD